MRSRVGTGQRLSPRIDYWIEYNGNRRGDGWCAHQLDDNETTMDWFILAYVG